MIFSGNEICIGEAVGIAPEKTRYPVRVVLLSGQPMYHSELGHKKSQRFVIDLSTVNYKNKILANYNHDDSEIIGIGENIRIENGELVCDGNIIPFRPNDRAEEIVYRAKMGIPFEASIEFVPAACEREEVKSGDSVLVNGMTIAGPALVYHNVTVRAYAVCPYGCDPQTKTMVLNQQRNMATQTETKTETKTDKTETKTDQSKYPDLDKLQEAFGAELGVRMFKEGVSQEEAQKVHEFNEKYGIVPKPDENAATNTATEETKTEKTETKSETAELKAEIAKLSAMNVKLTGEFAKLSAKLTATAEAEAVSGGQTAGGKEDKELSPKEQYLSNFAKRFA